MQLNNRKYEYWEKDITIQDVIDKMRYVYPRIIVKVNGKLIEKEEYGNFVLQENDDLKIHHLLAGG